MTVFVISKTGERLMPTVRCGRVRHLLKDGKAKIIKHNPFTIQLLYDSTSEIQEIEFCEDTGYQHIGVSIKSQKREYVHEQYDLLSDEKEKHDNRRMYRRTRRNRKTRYRKPRFNNRVSNKKKGWLAPSIKNKAEQHIKIFEKYYAVCPIVYATFEMGQFDTAVLEAIQTDKPIPTGIEYQYGERYGVSTLREAVFQRDNYKCIVCGRSALDKKNKAILHMHHALYWKGRHGNKLNELITCCEKCHTPSNHQKGGKLYGLEVKIGNLKGTAFMNTVKWFIYNTVKEKYINIDVSITYGANTKCKRVDLGLEKTHANDAYSMGKFHPILKSEFRHFRKKRRNNRILSKFYDAKYIDLRTNEVVSGKTLFNGKINRNNNKNGKNLHKYRGVKVKKGLVSIRKNHYSIRPGDIVLYNNEKYISKGVQSNGSCIKLDNGKIVSVKKVQVVKHINGWEDIT